MNILHITHNDADALGCALVVDASLRKEDTVKHHFCKTIGANEAVSEFLFSPEKEFDVVIISDISISEDTANQIEQWAVDGRSALLFDHHTSNKLNRVWTTVTSTDDYGKPRSAALLMLNCLEKQESFPTKMSEYQYDVFKDYITSISRYDTWLWKKEPEEPFNEENTNILIKYYGIGRAYERISNNLNHLLSTPFDLMDWTLISIYKENRQTIMEKSFKKVKKVKMGSLDVALFIHSGDYLNEKMEYVYEHLDVDIVMALFPDSLECSFRTNKSYIDVGQIAMQNFGGGGHHDAAGAPLDADDMIFWLRQYYDAPLLEV